MKRLLFLLPLAFLSFAACDGSDDCEKACSIYRSCYNLEKSWEDACSSACDDKAVSVFSEEQQSCIVEHKKSCDEVKVCLGNSPKTSEP